MEKVVKIHEEGDYIVYASKDNTKAMIVQIIKKEKRRRRDKDGNISIVDNIQKIYQKDVHFNESDNKLKPYDILDREFRKEIATAKAMVQDMVRKDSMGRNILNKLEKENTDE